MYVYIHLSLCIYIYIYIYIICIDTYIIHIINVHYISKEQPNVRGFRWGREDYSFEKRAPQDGCPVRFGRLPVFPFTA